MTITTAHPQAQAALAHAKRMRDQIDPAIWFDSWYNDQRDNNLDGRIDDDGEKGPRNADGLHYGRVYAAKVGPIAHLRSDQAATTWLKAIRVVYKVCIDVPIESYVAVGVPISRHRIIGDFFAALKAVPGWRVWLHGARPDALLDGDIVAANNHVHQHAGIVETGFVDRVVNLPGPTSARRYGVYTPSGLNDMVEVPRVLFESILGIECYARWVGR